MFCGKCGKQIVRGAKFCPECGQPVQSAGNIAENSGIGTFVLTINRAKQWFAINPAVKIIVDGAAEYRIDNGETLKIPITAGTHTIAFSCGIRNKIINANICDSLYLDIKWNRITGSLEVE